VHSEPMLRRDIPKGFPLADKLIVAAVVLTVLFATYRIGQSYAVVPAPLEVKPEQDLSARKIDVARTHQEWIEEISWAPRVFVYHNILTKQECDHIIEIVDHDLTPSAVSSQNGKGKFLSDQEKANELVVKLTQKIAGWTHIPAENGEDFWLTKYEKGEEWKPHVDTFNRDGSHDQFLVKGQRVASVFTYLRGPEEGGELEFPKLGIKIKPTAGTAVLIWDTLANAKEDDKSQHASLPVVKGTKYTLTKWIRSKKFQ